VAGPGDADPVAVAAAVADAAVVADGDVLAADGDGPALDGAELLADEQPARVTTTPAAARAARADRAPRTATDDTAPPTQDLEPTPDKVPVLVTAPGAARTGIRNNDAGTPAFASRRVGPRKGK
jgi:hypothetical protein